MYPTASTKNLHTIHQSAIRFGNHLEIHKSTLSIVLSCKMISTLAAKPCTARASGRISTVQVRSQTSAAAPRTAEADKPVITRRCGLQWPVFAKKSSSTRCNPVSCNHVHRHITIAAIVSGGALLYAQASSAVNAIEAKKRYAGSAV